MSTTAASCERLIDEVVARATSLACATTKRPRRGEPLPRPVIRKLDACERRARRLSSGRADLACPAALEFLGEAVAALAAPGGCGPGAAREVVSRAAPSLGLSEEAVAFAVYRRAITSVECVELSPPAAAELILSLLVELGPVSAASLWYVAGAGRTACAAAAGRSPRSRRLRDSARAALDGVFAQSDVVQSVIVERWERPYAALAARTRGSVSGRCADFLEDAAAALAPVLERDALFAQGAVREHAVSSADERRLVRVGFDLHDGPLQELVAFAEDIRLARDQVGSLIEPENRQRVQGRFDDLEARLVSLDAGLRQIVSSLASTKAAELDLESALRTELASFRRASSIEVDISVDGDLSHLTNSQRIVIFRVVQESLANVRKHSGAARAAVSVRSTPRFIAVSVRDDGRGFDVDETVENVRRNGRFGLAGVVERVRLLGGDVEIDAVAGAGTTVHATLPHWQPSTGAAAVEYAAAV